MIILSISTWNLLLKKKICLEIEYSYLRRIEISKWNHLPMDRAHFLHYLYYFFTRPFQNAKASHTPYNFYMHNINGVD